MRDFTIGADHKLHMDPQTKPKSEEKLRPKSEYVPLMDEEKMTRLFTPYAVGVITNHAMTLMAQELKGASCQRHRYQFMNLRDGRMPLAGICCLCESVSETRDVLVYAKGYEAAGGSKYDVIPELAFEDNLLVRGTSSALEELRGAVRGGRRG